MELAPWQAVQASRNQGFKWTRFVSICQENLDGLECLQVITDFSGRHADSLRVCFALILLPGEPAPYSRDRHRQQLILSPCISRFFRAVIVQLTSSKEEMCS